MFCKVMLFFISILLVFVVFMRIPRYFKRKNRYETSGQGDITISILMSLKNVLPNQTYKTSILFRSHTYQNLNYMG
jgi:hypothetical protein